MENALIVLNQLGIMTLMVSLGFIASKCLKIDKEGSRQMSLVLTRVITACVLLVSFLEVEANRENLVLLLLSWGLCLIAHLIAIALGGIFFQKDGKSRNAVAKFALTFTNNGFLGFPLVLVLCGQRGIFFASAAVMLSNILTWTYGVSLFQKHKLRFTGAMSGVISRIVAEQFLRSVLQRRRAITIGIQLHKMESPHQNIRPEPLHNIQNTLMGAAADADSFSVLFDQQILFVVEYIRIQRA